jgi:hypothetical protein
VLVGAGIVALGAAMAFAIPRSAEVAEDSATEASRGGLVGPEPANLYLGAEE